jgi:hypothetical protein
MQQPWPPQSKNGFAVSPEEHILCLPQLFHRKGQAEKSHPASSQATRLSLKDPWLSVPALRLVWLYLGFYIKHAFSQMSKEILQLMNFYLKIMNNFYQKFYSEHLISRFRPQHLVFA